MKRSLTRRELLAALAVSPLVNVACGTPGGFGAKPGDVFAHGVASGDPDSDSVVLWTRISGSDDAVEVRWSVALDEGFRQIVDQGRVVTGPERDHTVKVVAGNLPAGRRAWYRFESGGAVSPVGRTRTLPAVNVERLGLAVASCANFPLGRFHAYREIALDPDVDFVIHLGDYIYEYAADEWGAETGPRLGRVHLPPHEAITLDDYRTRLAQYRADPDLQAMHARHPVIMMWDDHETANNPWKGGADNHQDGEGPWQARRGASLQAWYEWLPVREPDSQGSHDALWRHYRFGDLASLVTLEVRHTGRDLQIDWGEHYQAASTPEGLARFKTDVLGDPDREILSADMTGFMIEAIDDIAARDVAWPMLASPVQVARVNWAPLTDPVFDELAASGTGYLARKLPAVRSMGQADLPRSFDDWGGYPAARERLFDAWTGRGIEDLLVLSGDTHGFWANTLSDDSGRQVGVELGTAGISSPGDSTLYGPVAGPLVDRAFVAHNDDVVWCNSMECGYLRVVLDTNSARADYVMVDDAEAAEYEASLLARFDVGRVHGRLSLEQRG